MTDYAFTLTLNPRIYLDIPESQFDQTYTHVYEKLKSITNNFTLVAELTKSDNIHYHGVIDLNQRRKFNDKFRKDRYIGFKCIKPLGDATGWKNYITKDLKDTTSSINRRPIINDHYRWFSLEDKAKYGQEWE